MSQWSVITKVTGAADSFKITTVGNIRADLGLTDTSISDDFFDRLNQQCSRAACQFCNREFALQNYTDTVRAPRDARPGELESILLANGPVSAVTAVAENAVALVLDTDYELDLGSGLVYRLSASSGTRGGWMADVPIVISYQAGYVLPEQTLPAPASGAAVLIDDAPDVEDAVIRMAKARNLARGRDPYLRSEDVAGVGRLDYWIPTGSDVGNLPPDVEDILNNYRIIPVS